MTPLDPNGIKAPGATMSGMGEMPYRYLVSYSGVKEGRVLSGHFPLDRSKPFSNAALMPVLDFIAERKGLDGPPVILGVFTFADSADAPGAAR